MIENVVLQAAMRLKGIDVLRLPLDEAIAVTQVFMTQRMNKEDGDAWLADLDVPIPGLVVPGQKTATAEEVAVLEDDKLLAALGLSRQALTAAGTPPSSSAAVIG